MGKKNIPLNLRLHKTKKWHSQWLVEKQAYAELLHFDLEIRKYLETLLNTESKKILKINIHRISKNIYIYVFLQDNRRKKKIFLKDQNQIIYYLNQYLNYRYNIKLFILKTNFYFLNYNFKFFIIFKYFQKKYKMHSKFRKQIIIFIMALITRKIQLISKFLQHNLKTRKMHIGYLKYVHKILSDLFKIHTNLLGYKIQIKGRVNGHKRKRKIYFQQGKLPFSTLNQQIEYAFDEFKTKSGLCSLKLWFCFKPSNNSILLRKSVRSARKPSLLSKPKSKLKVKLTNLPKRKRYHAFDADAFLSAYYRNK